MGFQAGNDSQDARDDFWGYLDRLVEASVLVIDRPGGSSHPRFPDFVYPLDYGYLEGTQAVDGGGIDAWVGSLEPRRITGIVCSVDLLKRDAEINILLGCSASEVETILNVSNRYGMRSAYIPRPQPGEPI